MPDLNIKISKETLCFLQKGRLSIEEILLGSLPIDPAEVNKPENELVHMLLAYHSDDGGSFTITGIKLNGATYDVESNSGKIDFKYFLSYHYACSYSETDYEKHDKVDFKVDSEIGVMVLTFLDLNTRSTSEEF